MRSSHALLVSATVSLTRHIRRHFCCLTWCSIYVYVVPEMVCYLPNKTLNSCVLELSISPIVKAESKQASSSVEAETPSGRTSLQHDREEREKLKREKGMGRLEEPTILLQLYKITQSHC